MQSTVCCDSIDEPATTTTNRKLISSPMSPSSVELFRSTSQSPPSTVAADAIPPSAEIQPSLKPALPTKSACSASSTDFSITSILSRQAPVKSSKSPPPPSINVEVDRRSPSPLSRDPNIDVVSTSRGRENDSEVTGFDVRGVGPPQRRADSDRAVGDASLSAALRQLLERQLVGPTAAAAVAAAAASGSPWYPAWLQSALLHRRIGSQSSSTDGLSFLLFCGGSWLDTFTFIMRF